MEKHIFFVWLVFSSQIVLAYPAKHQNDIEIYSLNVDCKVASRFAHTVITSRVVNRANESKEALFEVELPKTAFITNFSMTIDGKTYPGTIKEKKSAQDQYDAAVSRGQSAGLVKSTGRKLEQFHVTVNVAAAGKVTFELIYEELLKLKHGKYELLIKVKPKQLVNHFQIDAHIFEPQGINFLETNSTFMTNELSNALKIVQNENKAHISFKPTITQQKKHPELEETLLDGDFLIRYDVNRSGTAGDIQIINGYFVHYFAPTQMPVIPKNVVFVIDESGSMMGSKIQQTKEAMKKILEDLNPEDHFNLVFFSGSVLEWKPSLLQATEENIQLAKQYVQTIRAQGATDINRALLTATDQLNKATSSELLLEGSISIIILLTDGNPTTGVTNVNTIQENIKKANKEKYFLYCLGFGFDVSYTFLEKMALSNGGVARRIYEDSDAALQLQGFYQEVATPILKEIEMKYPENAVQELTQNNFKVLYDGSEIAVAGKIGNEIDILPVEIKAQTHTGTLTLKEEANVLEKEQVFEHQKYIFGNFMERLWAYLTIQQLLQKSISAEEEEQKSLEAKALELSLKYSFVTPLTSMVVTKPDAEEVANKPAEADNENLWRDGGRHTTGTWMYSRRPIMNLMNGLTTRHRDVQLTPLVQTEPNNENLRRDGGKSRIRNRLSGKFTPLPSTHEYPHFILHLPNENKEICLNIGGHLQLPISLLSDPEKGIQVTGKLGENRQFVQYEIAYQNPDIRIDVKEEIVLNQTGNATMLPWTTTISLTVQSLKIMVEEDKSLTLSGADNITIKISYEEFPEHFLGLYFMGTDNFSDQVTGLLGQFYFNTHFEKTNHRTKTKIIIQGQSHNVIRKSKKDYRVESRNKTLDCWSLVINP
ncbi:inter-alpha-trypsin inhibitor heavy chain H4-like isoform X2 [Hemicordylus capensis]|uniref:inter-alpha-trypsin inhibitor heavy chain H4-like isoform X2 n=1 Tax=Hemicordylus capensis TaxID=884348 RepID=UPI002303BCD3|nr:inter-alpha-trypsin inhibitor heavy chain H4-like isoform X2 [Hemicordylus capensis]